jgi:hypothetical protein
MVNYTLLPDNRDCKLVQDVGNRKDKKISTGARERERDCDIGFYQVWLQIFLTQICTTYERSNRFNWDLVICEHEFTSQSLSRVRPLGDLVNENCKDIHRGICHLFWD